jgi:hypothetical protein
MVVRVVEYAALVFYTLYAVPRGLLHAVDALRSARSIVSTVIVTLQLTTSTD